MFMPRATLHLPLFSGHIRNSCLPVANPFASSSPFLSSVALYTVGYYRSLYFQRGPTASRWKTETGGRGRAHRICCYVLRVSAVYTVYSYKGNRELMLWSIERTGRWREREGRFLSFPPRSLRARYSIHGQGFHPLSCYHRN